MVIDGAGFVVLVVNTASGKILRTVLQGETADVTTAEIRAFKSQGGEVL